MVERFRVLYCCTRVAIQYDIATENHPIFQAILSYYYGSPEEGEEGLKLKLVLVSVQDDFPIFSRKILLLLFTL